MPEWGVDADRRRSVSRRLVLPARLVVGHAADVHGGFRLSAWLVGRVDAVPSRLRVSVGLVVVHSAVVRQRSILPVWLERQHRLRGRLFLPDAYHATRVRIWPLLRRRHNG